MAATNLKLLLKEITDPKVQYNFWRLATFLEDNISNTTTVVNRTVNNTTVTNNGGEYISRVMDCLASVSIGDWVYQSVSQNNFAVEATTNDTPLPVLGRVILKPTPTTCEVVLLGIASGVYPRGTLYLNSSGIADTIPPATGYYQIIGTSFGGSTLLVHPEMDRVFLPYFYTLTASSSVNALSFPLSGLNSELYQVDIERALGGKKKSFIFRLNQAESGLVDQVYAISGDSINTSITSNIVGPNAVVAMTNNASFTIDITLTNIKNN